MNKNNNVWYSFQGCMIAVMPFIVSILIGIAAYYFMKPMFPPIVVWFSVINIFLSAWALLYMLKKKLGE